MKIHTLYQPNKTVISLEVFPPKKETGLDTVYQTINQLGHLKPDFISITYGAGGSEANKATLDVAVKLKQTYGIEPLHHLTCVQKNQNQLCQILDGLEAAGIENVLALRGDLPENCIERADDFHYAGELIEEIKSNYDFSVGAACYPEGHISQLASCENMHHLKKKEEAGADFFISQLFFENERFYRMLEEARKLGIKAPISAGVMPILSRGQVEKMIFMCGTSLPSKLIKLIHRYEQNIEDLRKAGLEYALEQMEDLLEQGVDGIHVYTMNRPAVAEKALVELREV